ncbi:Tubulin-specific chaperone B [Trichoplax sp. H2]|nr:Tubulin-specific chaperone B [Trichoplax sp. H2]|eukprot:RDD41602.1 Tubulin-specific chaperone B [Trichoplax sp. H2]
MQGNEGIIEGARVELLWFDGSIVNGIIKYTGPLVSMIGEWIGVQLDRPIGRHNGLFKGRQYFTCPHRYGVFTRPENIRLKQFIGRTSTLRNPSAKHKIQQSFADENLFMQYEVDDRPDYLRYKVAKPTGFVNSVYVSESLFDIRQNEEIFTPSRRYNRNHVISKTWKPKAAKSDRQERLIDLNFEGSFTPTASIPRVRSPTRSLNRTW